MSSRQRARLIGELGEASSARSQGAVVGALVFVVFAIQNSGSAKVDFLFWGFDLGLIVLMLLCAAIGAAVWELAEYLRRRNRA